MNKKKILTYAFVPALLGAAALGVNSASAHGMFGGFGRLSPEQMATGLQTKFDRQAKILGLSVDEVKNAWASGKKAHELAAEKGISVETLQARMKEARLEEIKIELNTLVGKGVITQSQADQRLKFMESNVGRGMKDGMKGRGVGWHRTSGPINNSMK